MTVKDFRTKRARLRPEDFTIPGGEQALPRDLITEETWTTITSLADDVSLRTSDHYGRALKLLWDLWGQWLFLVGALQAAVPAPADSPIARTACDAGDYFQASVYNALTGHYRLAYTSLRGVVENMALGLEFQVAADRRVFSDWLAGDEFGFGWAADRVTEHAHIATLDRDLMAAVGDNLYRQRRPPDDDGGLARRLFRHLSKYAHGAPGHTDGDIWQSNGPVFVPQAFEEWRESFLAVYALAVLQSRLAEPSLNKLEWDASFNARNLFSHAVRQLPSMSDAGRLFDAVPAAIWQRR